MALEARLSRAARLDLVEIWQFIAEDNAAAADRLLDRIDSVLNMLAANPEAGRARLELAPEIRSFPVGSYIIYYRPGPDHLAVVRVRNSYRDIDSADLAD